MDGFDSLDVTYVLIDGTALDSEDRRRTVYGVQVLDKDGNVLVCMRDVCTDKKCLSEFVNRFSGSSKERLSPIHIREVLEDFALSFYLPD